MIYDEIARTCPRQDILPNLHSLSWYTVDAVRQQRSLVFMHSNIKHIALQLHRSRDTPLSKYIDGILERTPHLLKLEVRAEAPMRSIQPELLALYRGLRKLRHLVSPMYFLTSGIISELSRAEKLGIIEFAEPVEQGTGDRADVAHFAPALNDGAFPSLLKLSFSAHLQHATQFISRQFMPLNLSCLYLHILAIDNPAVLQQFLSIIARRFLVLTELHVDFLLGPDSPIAPPPPFIARPNLDTLRPLMACSRLKVFELRWDYQLNLSESDLEKLAISWPYLEVLKLNSEPLPELTPPILTVEAILPFARHCRRLRELGLYIDGEHVPARQSASPQPFHFLEALVLGSSPIGAVEPMALFLSQLCPLSCRIVAGVRWPDAFGIAMDHAGIMDDRRMKMPEWWVKWNDVGKVLPLAIQARLEERGRMTALAREMDMLNVCRREEKTRVEELENEVRELRGLMEVGP
ncbi:hypothetical protein PHLCEN_2v4460 [Hermanssonia centrifuga]|uniref:F-box domain-containing protein n=1 Tax=Hermanssonia centrifuga TaxID=98765 RepID=A0A2R6PNI5_9APHY|nr:hypothetical protein PHLCEN_2v4460 [Hermanssonia centrifuga]